MTRGFRESLHCGCGEPAAIETREEIARALRAPDVSRLVGRLRSLAGKLVASS